MASRKPIKTTKQQIVEYWAKNVDESELSIDFSDAAERCWRCGCKSNLERCHIIPDSLGGVDSPDNLVLLCGKCHIEAPNFTDKEFFWEWLKAHKVSFYDTYWYLRGGREYELVYKEKFEDNIQLLNVTPEEFQEFIKSQKRSISIQFGQGRLNPSTIAGLLRAFIKFKKSRL